MSDQDKKALLEKIEKLENRLGQMRDSNERLEQILSSLDTGLSLIGKDRRIIWVNRKIREMFPHEDPIGNICYQFYESAQKPCDSCPTIRSFHSGRPHRTERYNPTQKRWFSIISQPVTDSSGKVVNVLEGVTDITERKEAERALKASEEKYRDLVQNARDVIYTLDREGNFLEVNEAFLREGGWSREEIFGTNFKKLLHPDEMQIAMEAYQKGLAGQVAKFEMRALRKDGTYHWYSFINRPLKDKNGKILGITGIARDIDARKLAEEKLRNSEKKYRLLFEQAPISLWEEDFSEVQKRLNQLRESGIEDFRTFFGNRPEVVRELVDAVRIIDVNKATLYLYGAKSKKQLMRGLSLIFSEESLDDFITCLVGICRGETSFYFEKVHKKLSGDRIHIKLNWRAVPQKQVDYSRVLVSVVDITDIKQYEARLREKQKMEALGTLAGGVAHEINNILAVILGNAELASGDVSGYDPVRNYLEEIRIASLRAKDVIRNILTVARKDMASRKPVRIADVLVGALPLVCEGLPDSVAVRKVIRCDRETVLADPAEIREVLMNLCSNSVHALGNGPGDLTISLETVEVEDSAIGLNERVESGKYVRLMVMDTGIGISPDIMDRIFDPYFTTKDVDEGIGMGLAVVNAIVKKNKGVIHVESQVKKGTSVTVLFPLHERQG